MRTAVRGTAAVAAAALLLAGLATPASAAAVNIAPLAEPSASYTAGWNSLAAVNDGEPPVSEGGDHGAVWGTFGDNPESQWLQYDWPYPATVESSAIWFWHDAPPNTGGNVAVPESWTLQYLDAASGGWVDVTGASGFGVAEDGANETTFDPVTTTGIRATFQASPGTGDPVTYAGVAVSEWEVRGEGGAEPEVPVDPNRPIEVREIHIPTAVGVEPDLPGEVELVYEDGRVVTSAVTWAEPPPGALDETGSFVLDGAVEGLTSPVTATVHVRNGDPALESIDPAAVITLVGAAPRLPSTVVAVYDDGSRDSRIPVEWDEVDPSSYAGEGLFELGGDAEGTDVRALVYVFVEAAPSGDDVTAPTLVIEAAPEPAASGWYTRVPQVTVTATDDRDSEPAVEYRIDEGEWTAYSAPFPVDQDGVRTVSVRATDEAGNTGEAQQVLQVDATAPETVATFEDLGGSVEVTLVATDSGSGVERIQWEGPGTFLATYQQPFTRALTDEPQVITFLATDVAGNEEEARTIELPALADAEALPSSTSLEVKGYATSRQRLVATADVDVPGGSTSGTVEFLVDGRVVGEADTAYAGRARVQLPQLSRGVHYVSARFTGDAAGPSVTPRKRVLVL